MSLYSERQFLQGQLAQLESLLETSKGHPLMYPSLKERYDRFHQQLNELPADTIDPKVTILFAGKPVYGSMGIDVSFLSGFMDPFQKMIDADFFENNPQNLKKRKQKIETGGRSNTALYLTALPRGSFGIELSQLENEELFDSLEISKTFRHVLDTLEQAQTDKLDIDSISVSLLKPLKELITHLDKKQVSFEVEHAEKKYEFTKDSIHKISESLTQIEISETNLDFSGKLRGVLLESGVFEFSAKDPNEELIKGKISLTLLDKYSETQIIDMYNKNSVIVVSKTEKKIRGKNSRPQYELLDITLTNE